jgi:hypothetical protein
VGRAVEGAGGRGWSAPHPCAAALLLPPLLLPQRGGARHLMGAAVRKSWKPAFQSSSASAGAAPPASGRRPLRAFQTRTRVGLRWAGSLPWRTRPPQPAGRSAYCSVPPTERGAATAPSQTGTG